jgi:hypothetical protein
MRWTGHVARKGDKGDTYRFFWGNLRERDNLDDIKMNLQEVVWGERD